MTNDEMAGLPEDVRRFVAHMDSAADSFDTPFKTSVDPKQWSATRAELLRLAQEVDRLIDCNSVLGSACDTDFARAERAESELAALKKRIDEAPTCTLRAIVQGNIVWPVASDLSGDTRVALLPVGGE